MVSWPNFLDSLSSDWVQMNLARGGATTADLLSRVSTDVVPNLKLNGKNIVVVWAGTNDPSITLTAAQSWANLSAYADAIHTAVPTAKIIVATMISRVSEDVFKNQLNALILANWRTKFDALADVASNSNIGADGAFSNVTFFVADQIHSSTLANQTIEKPLFQTEINKFL